MLTLIQTNGKTLEEIDSIFVKDSERFSHETGNTTNSSSTDLKQSLEPRDVQVENA